VTPLISSLSTVVFERTRAKCSGAMHSEGLLAGGIGRRVELRSHSRDTPPGQEAMSARRPSQRHAQRRSSNSIICYETAAGCWHRMLGIRTTDVVDEAL
jgi:hypothetical protein